MPRSWRLKPFGGDLYIGRSTLLKSFLLLGVTVISTVFIWYTFSVIEVLQHDTRQQVDLYVRLWQEVANSPVAGGELQVIFDEIILKASFPIVVCDNERMPVAWRNIPGIPTSDTSQTAREKLIEVVREMRHSNGEFPLFVSDNLINYFYYGEPDVIKRLRLMPFIEIGIVLAFLVVGVIGFQNIRRSEERLIWVGMAKETAHQLGTPISSLLGWLELIKEKNRTALSPEDQAQLIRNSTENMEVDVSRLQQVANRFGLIGSVPDLEPQDLNVLINDAVVYFRRRLPFQGKGVQIDFKPVPVPPVRASAELLGWAFENLIKNALQAADASSGRIALSTSDAGDGRHVRLEISDNGSGISAAAARKIFRPGFTTKHRGWGMGLTLVKRIIEEYHGGRVELKSSRPGETVFEIYLLIDQTNNEE